MEIHIVDPLVPETSPLEVGIAIEKMKSDKFPGTDQFSAEVIQAGGEHYVVRAINSLILFGIRKNCLISGSRLLFYQFIRKAIKPTVVIIEAYHSHQFHTKIYTISFSQG
jgi:hypothetical protein